MTEMKKMLIVPTVICGVCGFLLAGVRYATEERIEDQIMRYVKGPAVKRVLAGAVNDPVEERREVDLPGGRTTVFIGRDGDGVSSIAYETTAQGFGGELGVMVGYDVRSDRLLGVAVTSHRETPGMGARVAQDDFRKRFAGKPLQAEFKVTREGGEIDAVTGATTSSRAVCAAVAESAAEYPQVKTEALK